MKRVQWFIRGLLLGVFITGIILGIQLEKTWKRVHALEQSPDICWKCGNDIDAVAAEKEAARIFEVHGK